MGKSLFLLPLLMVCSMTSADVVSAADGGGPIAGDDPAVFVPVGFDEISMHAELVGDTLVLKLRNSGLSDVLIQNDFCESAIYTRILGGRLLISRKDGFSGTGHVQRGIAKLAPGAERLCGFGYLNNNEPKATEKGDGAIVWRAKLFVASADGKYSYKLFTGALPIIFPLTSNTVDADENSSALRQFKRRSKDGLID